MGHRDPPGGPGSEKACFIDHGAGVVIGETAVIGDNVTLYQGGDSGRNRKGNRGNAILPSATMSWSSAGAKLLGSFTVGENAKIGAGSVVLEEVPPNCTVVGIPGRIVKRANEKIPRETMDQGHLPDPVQEDINVLQKENTELVNRVLELEAELRNCPGRKKLKELERKMKRDEAV